MHPIERLNMSYLLAFSLTLGACGNRAMGEKTDLDDEPDDADEAIEAPDGEGVLAVGQAEPCAILVDASFVYWANRGSGKLGGGSIMKVARDGGEPIVVADGLDTPEAMVVDSGGVSWTSHGPNASGGLFRTSLDGGAVFGLANVDVTRGLASFGDELFWTSGPDASVQRVSSKGGSPATIASGQLGVGPLVTAGESMYWGTASEIVRKDISGLGADVIWQGERPVQLAATSGAIVWSTERGDVFSADANGDGARLLAPADEASPFTRAVALDAERAYFTDAHNGTVNAVALAGGPVTTIASDQDHPAAITVDGDFVYWVDSERGTVMRAPTRNQHPSRARPSRHQ